MEKIIGIDVGTSSVKICLYGIDGNFIQEQTFMTERITPKRDFVELDVNQLFMKILEALKSFEHHLQEVVSISFSVTSPTLIFLDESNEAIGNGILYLDNRVSDILAEYKNDSEFEEYFTYKTGNHISSSTCSALLIKWFLSDEKRSNKKLNKVCFLNSYLAYRFSGILAVEPTVCSYSGLTDIRLPYVWDSDLLNKFQIDKKYLPMIRAPFEKIGNVNEDIRDALGLGAETTVSLGAADTAVSSYILNINENKKIFQSLGTSEVFTVCLDEPVFSKAFMNRSHVMPGKWLAHGAMSSTGAAINWLNNDVLRNNFSFNQLEELAMASTIGSNGVIFLPYLSGERSPYFDKNATGVFFGLNIHINQSDIVRAVFEGAAYGMYGIYEIAKSLWNLSQDNIVCVGGGAKSDLAIQMRSDLYSRNFETVRAHNPAAYGAAMLGAVAAGYYELEKVPFLEERIKQYTANKVNKRKYLENYETYQKLYPLLKDLMREHEEKKLHKISN